MDLINSARECSPSVSSLVSLHSQNFIRQYRRETGRGLSLAPGAQIPDVIQRALETTPPSRRSSSNRESMQRKRYWWLPYVVLEFDKNEILIDALGGDLSSPVWNYRADLCVSEPSYYISSVCSLLSFNSDVSRTSNISVSSYLRTAAAVQGQDDMGNDLLMGRVDLTPMLDGHVSLSL
jgi:serum/glucocorticoid-regulated kinase 2